ncbi:glycosyltransferase family 2 protein [Adhaeribacter radiodurans]|uniref:Glycosyltransferase family 2 protein n=1 Tax=Adhaeribacter radiodurans TaxID=2745197 RepID=A0A7L7L212_9BACT|nr:glycosyltransferase family 2 protein [Adhaeribacter radiodurans]QMU26824.1 glycosyltransferase family 2 protein [Adhaeribacter radiodurans]
MPQLDLILPCYNPSVGWKENIIHTIYLLKQSLPDTEIFIILVNDGSISGVKPGDLDLLKQTLPNFTFISYHQNQGKGYALRRGVQEAKHDLCIYTDVDFPYSIKSFIQLYNALISPENDIVVGVRDKYYYSSLTQNRTIISKFLQVLNQYFLNLPVTDTQCGLKGFNKKGRQVFLRTKINRYLFDLEFIFLAAQNPDVKLLPVLVQLQSGTIFQKMGWRILTMEVISLLKLTLAKAKYLIKK